MQEDPVFQASLGYIATKNQIKNPCILISRETELVKF